MKKLFLTMVFFVMTTACFATKTTINVQNNSDIEWKFKVESSGKWISDWMPVKVRQNSAVGVEAKDFTVQVKSGVTFKITAVASDYIILRKNVKGASDKVSITISGSNGKYSLQ